MRLYNSLTRKIEKFIPITPPFVKMYTCGPTVYNFAHIGNLRTYIHEDILEKTLILRGYVLKRAMNITDVGHLTTDADEGEDKMLEGAKRENKSVYEIAEQYTNAFFEDIEKLNIKKPKIIEKASDNIKEYIEMIRELERKNFTYFLGGNVYFDISKFSDYTKLSNQELDTLLVGVRDTVGIDANKKNPQDFVLWFTESKFENQDMKWDSPWGFGYPGWHIECSAIAIKTLGDRLDIHCGGVDHIKVHHSNEIAQSESYLGHKWCNYWWHSEFLLLENSKMSKSKGSFVTVKTLEENSFKPLSFRYYVLGSHYRKQLGFSFEKLEQAQKAYEKLLKRCKELIKHETKETLNSDRAKDFLKEFKEHIFEDLNTANALSVLYSVLNSDLDKKEKYKLVKIFDEVLSLSLLDFDCSNEEISEELREEIEKLIIERDKCKIEKDYKRADEIRDYLLKKNIKLIDSKSGTNFEII